MANEEYEHHEYVEEEEGLDIEQEVYNLQTSLDAILELLIEKNVITESEFEKKFDEICEMDEEDSEDETEESDDDEN